MNRIAAIIVSSFMAFATMAAPLPVPDEFQQVDGDTMMPSLSELLGGDVDNFGEFESFMSLKNDLVDYACRYIGTRYKGGGKTPGGFDCSGFTSYVFRNFGMALHPASVMQSTQGESVSIDEIEVGDLMFFSGRKGGSTVGHVGMVVSVDRQKGTCDFIHASCSQGVVIQHFPDNGYYSKRFLKVRRVIGIPEVLAKK